MPAMRKALLALLIALAAPALAVVPSTTSRVDAIANGSATVFTFNFPVTTSSSHVEVLVAGVKQVSGYTVSLYSNQASVPGGMVIFTTPPGAGAQVRIQRTVPLTQETVYTPYSAFPAKTTEKALDRLVYQMQQLARDQGDVAANAAAAASSAASSASSAASSAAAAANAVAAAAVPGSDTLVTATGAATPKALKDHLATLPDAKVTAAGTTTSRALAEHLASVPDARVAPTGTGATPATIADGLAELHAALDRVQAQRRFFAPLTTYTGCQAAPTGTDGEAFTIVRATDGAGFDAAGVEATCTANEARFSGAVPRGLLVESTRSNLISVPDAPVNQTGKVIGTGSYYLRIEGAGSLTVTLATGAATGLPCTATASAPCAFSVTSAGTIDTTVVAPVTFAQLENGSFPTTRIHGTGRNYDNVSIVNPLRASDDWCVWMTAEPLLGQPWRIGATRALFGIGDNTVAADSAYAAVDPNGKVVLGVRDQANGSKAIECAAYNLFADDWLTTRPHEFQFCNAGGSLSVKVNGVAPKCWVGGSGTGKIGTMPATLTLGYAKNWAWLNGVIRDFGILARESRDPGPLDANAVACVGSSSTGNEHLALADRYPTRLGVKLGAPWVVANQGASGNTTAEMTARWRAGIRRYPYKWIVALPAMNDYQLGHKAEAITPRIQSWFDAIRAEGRTLVVVKLPPANDSTERCAERQAVNTWLGQYCTTYGVTCVDGAAVIADPGDPCRMAPAYDNGNLHYNAAGAEALATAVRAAFP
jgi:hypothetical protein